MIALIQRILRLAEGYRTRIRLAAVCSFVKAFLGKAPIVIAYFMIKGFIENSVTGKTCLLAGAALVLCLALIVTLVFYGIGEAMKKNTLMHSAERQAAAQQRETGRCAAGDRRGHRFYGRHRDHQDLQSDGREIGGTDRGVCG